MTVSQGLKQNLVQILNQYLKIQNEVRFQMQTPSATKLNTKKRREMSKQKHFLYTTFQTDHQIQRKLFALLFADKGPWSSMAY